MNPIFILNGPNLNLLGQRELNHYGSVSLRDIEILCQDFCNLNGYQIVFKQTNHEGELVDWVQESIVHACGLILNAGAYTHTSIAIYDALMCVKVPVIEVHLSQIYKREAFRSRSLISKSPSVIGVISGFGSYSYILALMALHTQFTQ